jgi:hypothetical protein
MEIAVNAGLPAIRDMKIKARQNGWVLIRNKEESYGESGGNRNHWLFSPIWDKNLNGFPSTSGFQARTLETAEVLFH